MAKIMTIDPRTALPADNPIIEKYFRKDMMPHIWCAGCGNAILMRDIANAFDQLNLDKDQVCVVSGIGCSSRAAGYMDFNTIHTTHGRAIPVATGIKMARPEMTVLVITGDGDAVAIGGNHFIHGARRNIDLTIIVFNNNIYGMTGGQYSPTTPTGDYGTTAPYGTIDQDFDICRLAAAAGATYVARGTAYHVRQTTKLMVDAIQHKGFSVVDCVSICPTYYGRKNKKGDAVDMLKWQKENTVFSKPLKRLDNLEDGKLEAGLFYQEERPEYCQQYQALVDRIREEES